MRNYSMDTWRRLHWGDAANVEYNQCNTEAVTARRLSEVNRLDLYIRVIIKPAVIGLTKQA